MKHLRNESPVARLWLLVTRQLCAVCETVLCPSFVLRIKGRSAFCLYSGQPVGLTVNWLQTRPFGPYLSTFSTNSYGYYSQTS